MFAGASSPGKEVYEFGPFRIDPEKEVLLRDGEPVSLTPKNFQILLVLVRNSQQVVTKDDLMKTVWPDTFVEEANLSRNIFMLRKALGETPQDHQYIITVPGRGYRLAEDVRLVPGQDMQLVAASRSTVKVEIRDSKPWALITATVIVGLVLLAAAYRYFFHRAPVLGEKDTVVLADFTNSTGDSVFDGTLRQGVAVQLEQSPFLSIISEERIRQTLQMMGKPPDARLTPELAREVCERTGSAAVLDGSIAMLGNQYVLGFRARDCRSGRVFDDQQIQAAKKEEVLPALGTIATAFRSHAGESLATRQKYDTPLEATTPSLDALKAYSTGFKVLWSSGSVAAMPFFQHAVELDPDFAMAHAMLGRMYGDIGEFDLSAQSTSRAYELREHASERERFLIAASYDLQVTGNLEKAQQTAEAWEKVYPRDVIPHSFLSGIIYPALGKYELAAEKGEETIRLNPDFWLGYLLCALAYQELERLPEAERALQRAADRKLDVPDYFVERYDLAFLKNDAAEMQRLATVGKKETDTEAWIVDHEAFVAAYRGRLTEAEKLKRRAVELTQQIGQHERAAQFEVGGAVWAAMEGDFTAAQESAHAALAMSHDRDVEYGAAFAFASAGDSTRAQALIDDLEKRFPSDTSVKFSYEPVLRAALALKRGDAEKALKALDVASPYDFGTPRSSQHAFFGALYPIFMRGEAYLLARNGEAAAAEFEKILAHPGIVVSDPVGAIARLNLARAYVVAGDKEKARTTYRDFLALWKDADDNVPALREAKEEYSRLP